MLIDIIETIAAKEADVEGFKTVLLRIDDHDGAAEAIFLKLDESEAALARHRVPFRMSTHLFEHLLAGDAL